MRFLLIGLLTLASAVANSASAIPPPYVSDEQLAAYPIIVVAHWDGSPFEDRDKVVDNACEECESGTRIRIKRVIQGSIATGAGDLLITDRFGWTAKYPGITTYTSTQMNGDVEDTQQENLWFLKRGRSWKAEDAKEYLLLDNYRCVQPLKFEAYFDALRGPAPEREVPKHLLSEDPDIAGRVLSFLCGGDLSWPYQWERFSSFQTEVKRKRLLVEHAPNVLNLTDAKRPPETRRTALAVYAEMTGKEGLPRVRRFLKDDDSGVRALAVGILARARDTESLPAMFSALEGVDDGWLAFCTIQSLGEWDDLGAELPVIALLQNDKPTYHMNQDYSNVALNAMAALKKRTGVEFPLDVAVAKRAWDGTRPIADPDERRRRLEEKLGSHACPLEAEVVNRNGRPLVIARNRSKEPLVVARRPQNISLRCEGGVGGASGGEITGRESFIELSPGGTSEIVIDTGDFLDHFLRSERGSRKSFLEYLRNGNEFGLNAWMGVVVAQFGKSWEEPPRKEGVVEERWPNGWLKARGKMVDGRKHGSWTYWREDGRKKSEWEWFNGSPSNIKEFNSDKLEPDNEARPIASTPDNKPESKAPSTSPESRKSAGPMVVLGSVFCALLVGAGIWRRRRTIRRSS